MALALALLLALALALALALVSCSVPTLASFLFPALSSRPRLSLIFPSIPWIT